MLIFFTIELILSTISCTLFLIKSTECRLLLNRVFIYIIAVFIPIYIIFVYLDFLLILSLFVPYSFILFSTKNVSKKISIYMITLLQAIIFSVTSAIILVVNFFITKEFYKSIIDITIEFCVLIILIIIKRDYLNSKFNNFFLFIPRVLKIFIVISLYIISLFAFGLSYISKTEFTNQSWYYFLEFSFLFLLIVFCVAYPIFISNVTSKNYYKKISEIANEQSKLQYNYYQKLIEKEQSLKEFKHNYKNQLIILNTYLEKQDLVSAKSYLDKSFEFLNEISSVQTGNYILDALVSDKKQSADDIDIQIKGIITAEFIDPIDICTIFGNALDNAIEACKQIKDRNKVIKINLKETENTVHICISNPVDKPVRIVNNNISTTKEDKSNHGFGLYSINKCVRKYNGNLNLECKDNVFSLSALLVNIKKT